VPASVASRWREATPTDARRWLAGARAPWWIAAGWALDLWLGRRTRAHADLDVGCFRADLGSLRAALAGWELYVADRGTLRPVHAGEQPAAAEHALWCRPPGDSRWALEILLEERSGACWRFRRDASIALPIERLALATADGIPFLRPEVQLLYKAKDARARDDIDLGHVLPTLDRAALEWLDAALALARPPACLARAGGPNACETERGRRSVRVVGSRPSRDTERARCPLGRSHGLQLIAGSSSPSRRQPSRASQVRGGATGGGPIASGSRTPGRQPRNQGPDDAGSIRATRGSARPGFARCLRAFRSTYRIAFRTSATVRNTWRW